MGKDGEESLVYYKIADENSWALNLYEAQYGDVSFKASDKMIAELNPGSPVIAMPL